MIVLSNRLAAYTKRAVVCFALACEVWTSANAADAAGASGKLCPSPEITIFSCQTKQEEIISICLSLDSKLTVLSKQKSGPLESDIITSAQEAIIGDNPHGVNVVLELKSASRKTRLFAALDPYDMSPAIFEIGDGPESRKVCVFDTQVLGAGVIKENGRTQDVGLTNLESAGFATKLANVPKWPETR